MPHMCSSNYTNAAELALFAVKMEQVREQCVLRIYADSSGDSRFGNLKIKMKSSGKIIIIIQIVGR